MKKFGIYFMMLAMMMAVTFVACNKTDDDIQNPDITISKIVLDQADLDAFEFNVSVIAYEELTSVKYYVLYETAEMVPVTITSFEKGAKTWAKKFDASDFATVIPLLGGLPEGAVLKFVVEVKTASTSADKTEPIEIKKAPPVETPLTTAVEFKLQHPQVAGAHPKTAMGITYDKNPDVNTARFTTASNSLVILPNEETYNAITTQESLKAAFDAAPTKLDVFTASPSVSNFKQQYLIVKDGETLRLIKMIGLTFDSGINIATFTEKH